MANYQVPSYDHDHESEVMLFAETNFRSSRRKFGIKTDDRRRHIYVIGKTGMGKTTLLETMVLHDVTAGHGLAYIDPHGDTARKILDFIPPNRINDVVYFNPADTDFPVGFNPLETSGSAQEKNLVGQGLMGVFKKIWGPEVFSARMEYIMLNTVMALLDAPGSTLLGINRIYVDEDYRKRVVSLIQDPSVKAFWVKEFAGWEPKYRTEAVAAIQNKVGQFLSSAIIRNIVAQVKSTINLREIMDGRKILVCNLSKGMVGEEASRLLGAMLITRIQLAAMERVDIEKESDRQDFYLYVDEFQNFATESFANILSEARKYRLNLIVAHQYIEQLDETVRAAVFGNVGTMVVFRVGAADATFMEQEFAPRFLPEDLVNLKKYDVYMKLMIDGATSQPFSASTLLPIEQRTDLAGALYRTDSSGKVLKVSRERYASPREKIEEKVLRWSGIATVSMDEEAAASDAAGAVPADGERPAIWPSAEVLAEEKEFEDQMKVLEATSPKIPEYVKPGKKKPAFQAPCSICGKMQGLTFEPDWTRPWFCKEDLEKRKAAMERGEKVPEPTVNALGLPLGEAIPPEKLPPGSKFLEGIKIAVVPGATAGVGAGSELLAAPVVTVAAPPPKMMSLPVEPIVRSEVGVKSISLVETLGRAIPKGPLNKEVIEEDEEEVAEEEEVPMVVRPASPPMHAPLPSRPPAVMAPKPLAKVAPPQPPTIIRPTTMVRPTAPIRPPQPFSRPTTKPPMPPQPTNGGSLKPGDTVKL